MARHLDADGRPLLEAAAPDAWHLLAVERGPTADTSPGFGVEVRIERGRVRVIHWLRGKPFCVVREVGRA